MLTRFAMARRLAGLLLAGLALVTPAGAEGDLLISASVADASRVHATFLTMDVLMERCGTATGTPELYAAGLADWVARNQDRRDLADVVLDYLHVELDPESLMPRAEADATALLNALVTPSELCARFLAQIAAGDLDLSTLVPDLDYRLIESAAMIAGAN